MVRVRFTAQLQLASFSKVSTVCHTMAQKKDMLNRMAIVSNLPPDASADEMKQLCSQVGEVILFRYASTQ